MNGNADGSKGSTVLGSGVMLASLLQRFLTVVNGRSVAVSPALRGRLVTGVASVAQSARVGSVRTPPRGVVAKLA